MDGTALYEVFTSNDVKNHACQCYSTNSYNSNVNACFLHRIPIFSKQLHIFSKGGCSPLHRTALGSWAKYRFNKLPISIKSVCLDCSSEKIYKTSFLLLHSRPNNCHFDHRNSRKYWRCWNPPGRHFEQFHMQTDWKAKKYENSKSRIKSCIL